MACHRGFCGWSHSEVYFILSLITLLSGIFVGTNADEVKVFCLYATNKDGWREKLCNPEEKGFGILIDKVRFSKRAPTFNKSECSDLYDDEETEDIDSGSKPKLLLEKACNGWGSCKLGNFPIPKDSAWAYIISFKCIRVDLKMPFDPSKPTFNVMKNFEETKVTGTAVLSTRVLAQKQPINRTCHALSANEGLTLKVLHLDLNGNQDPKSCSGLLNVTSSTKELFSVNCTETEWTSYYMTSVVVEAGTTLRVSLSLREGFVWLKILGGQSGFMISCNEPTNEGKPTTWPDPNKTPIPIPFPSGATANPRVQPEPGKTYGPRSSTTTKTMIPTTTASQSSPKDPTGSITIVVAVVSAIAGVATTVAIVLAVYLCKTRDSPYQRWRHKRQSRLVAAQDGNARPKPRHYANQRDEEYARVEPNQMMTSPNSTAPADSGMYDSPDCASIPPPLPPSPRPLRCPDQGHDPYVNEDTQVPLAVQGMTYSEVVMMNPKEDGIKIYAPGFYHTAGNREPSPRPGGDSYDVMGATSGQYMHLRDTAVKENYLPKNVYDG